MSTVDLPLKRNQASPGVHFTGQKRLKSFRTFSFFAIVLLREVSRLDDRTYSAACRKVPSRAFSVVPRIEIYERDKKRRR